MTISQAERQAKLRKNRKSQGYKSYMIWLKPATQKKVEYLKRPRESIEELFERALNTLNVSKPDNKKLLQNEANRRKKLVVEAQDLRERGLTFGGIATLWNKDKVQTLSETGKWYSAGIKRLCDTEISSDK